MPTVPVKAAGWRIEPPGSVPVAPRQRWAATAAAEPPGEPPGTSRVFAPAQVGSTRLAPASSAKLGRARVRVRRHGETAGPKHEVSFDEPIANSSLLSLPSSTAPSRHRFAHTVDS